MANKTREPLVHISRRSTLPWYQSWGIRACALILSLGVCALVTMFTTGENPLSVFGAIYDASFSSQRRTWVLFQNIAMLLWPWCRHSKCVSGTWAAKGRCWLARWRRLPA